MKNLKTLFLIIALSGAAFSLELSAAVFGKTEVYDFSKSENYKTEVQNTIEKSETRRKELETQENTLRAEKKIEEANKIKSERDTLRIKEINLTTNLNDFTAKENDYNEATTAGDTKKANKIATEVATIADNGQKQIDALNAKIKTIETDLGSQEVKDPTKVDVTKETDPLETSGETSPEAPTVEEERTSYIKKVVDFFTSKVKKALSSIADAIDVALFGKEGANSDANIFANIAEAKSNYSEQIKTIDAKLSDLTTNSEQSDALKKEKERIKTKDAILEAITGEQLTPEQAKQIVKDTTPPQESLSSSENTLDIENNKNKIINKMASEPLEIADKLEINKEFERVNARKSAFEIFTGIELDADFTSKETIEQLDSTYENLFAEAKNYPDWESRVAEIKVAYDVLKDDATRTEEIEKYNTAKTTYIKDKFDKSISYFKTRTAQNIMTNASTITKAVLSE